MKPTCPLKHYENCNYYRFEHDSYAKQEIIRWFCNDGGFPVCRHYRRFLNQNKLEVKNEGEMPDL